MPLQKQIRSILDQIDSHCPTFDARTIRSEIENLGEVYKEAVKRDLKDKYIFITTDH